MFLQNFISHSFTSRVEPLPADFFIVYTQRVNKEKVPGAGSIYIYACQEVVREKENGFVVVVKGEKMLTFKKRRRLLKKVTEK